MSTPEELRLLIEELQKKGLLKEDYAQMLDVEKDGTRARLLGYLDRSIENNEITIQQATRYIQLLGFTEEELDGMRSSSREERERKLRLN